MRPLIRLSSFSIALVSAGFAFGQTTGGTDRNLSKMAGHQSECAMAKNPSNKLQLYAACNHDTTGLFAAQSNDGGVTWVYPDADKTVADGDANQGPQAWSDPNVAWDTFGNLYVTYVDHSKTNIVTILSTDGGTTFSTLATFGPASVDQPTIVAANTTAAGAPVAFWVIWNKAGSMVARGAAVTGAGVGSVGAFGAEQAVPGTANCSFGDLAVAPDGTVVQVCESTNTNEGPSTLRFNIDADGLGPGNFGAAATVANTNVGPFDVIPAQDTRTVDAEAGLAYDRNPMSAHFGRVYLVYTQETPDESNDTNIMVMSSDNNGGAWSAATQVNDDAGTRSQFFPRIASNSDSGNIAICWLDCRNSATNTAVQEFCTIATPPGFPAFISANAQISDGSSTAPAGNQFGDYAGLAYFMGVAHPVWPDRSNSTGDNPGGTSTLDAYSDRVSGGMAANEGDPHLTTVDGVHYDFQGAGEFVALRDPDGLEIQTRQTPIATTFDPGPGSFGLGVCVSLNSAVAARVGTHRVTYQPNVSGVPDPSGMQLRIDGQLQTLGPSPINLGGGGRVVESAAGNGLEIDFPNGTLAIVTPLFWTSQGKWYLNLDVFSTPATDGIMGAIAQGSWLPALPNGASMGLLPGSLHQRYVGLYQTFADAWRVTDATTLFDYATGKSTASFTNKSWPPEQPPCQLPEETPAKPLSPQRAKVLCAKVGLKDMNADCNFDVRVTGEPGFAKLYLLSQRIRLGATNVTIAADRNPSLYKEAVVFTVTVSRKVRAGGKRPAFVGTVQFYVDGKKLGDVVSVDSSGRAIWRISALSPGEHRVSGRFIPASSSTYLASSSDEKLQVVRGKEQ